MRFLCILLLSAIAVPVAAQQFYPVVDADGKVHLLVRPDTEKNQTPKASTPEPTGGGVGKSSSSEAADGPVIVDGEQYQSSEDLEEHGYKPKGKKRFYYFSDHSMGVTPVVSDKGVPVIAPVSDTPSPDDIAKPSQQYERLTTQTVGELLTAKDLCFSRKIMRHAVPVTDAVSLTINPPLTRDDEKSPDLLVDVRKGGAAAFRLRSYANRKQDPFFYIPLPVFLDGKGCVLGGAWNYWTARRPANQYGHEMIDGLLLPPHETAFIAFFRPSASSLHAPVAFGYPGSLTLESFQ